MEIQLSEEKKNKLSPSSALCQVSRHLLPISCLSVSDVWRSLFSAVRVTPGFFLITNLSQNQDKYTETSCHCDNVHTAELDSETGSLYSWGLKLINPRRKITVRDEVSITEPNLTSQSEIITLTSSDREIWRFTVLLLIITPLDDINLLVQA